MTTTPEVQQAALTAIAALVTDAKVQVVDICEPDKRRHWRIRLITPSVKDEPFGLHPDPLEALSRFTDSVKRYLERKKYQ